MNFDETHIIKECQNCGAEKVIGYKYIHRCHDDPNGKDFRVCTLCISSVTIRRYIHAEPMFRLYKDKEAVTTMTDIVRLLHRVGLTDNEGAHKLKRGDK